MEGLPQKLYVNVESSAIVIFKAASMILLDGGNGVEATTINEKVLGCSRLTFSASIT